MDTEGTEKLGEPSPRVAATPERFLSKRPPTQSARALWQWLKAAAGNFSRINGTVWSASFAYYAFFALVPLVLVLVTISTAVAAHVLGEEGAKGKAFSLIVENIPLGFKSQQTIATTLEGVMKARGQMGIVAMLGLLWSSLGFFQALVSAVNQAWGYTALNWWKLPLKNLMMVGVLLSSLVLGVLLPALLQTLQDHLKFGGVWMATLFTVAGVLVPSIVLFYGFLLFYKMAPRRRTGVVVSMVWLPALFVTAALQASQKLFVFYATRITDFNAVYGAFGVVVAMLLWIYLTGLIIVFGGSLCAAQREMQATPEDPA